MKALSNNIIGEQNNKNPVILTGFLFNTENYFNKDLFVNTPL